MGYTAVEPHPAGIHPGRCASRWDPSSRDFSRCMFARGKQVAMLYSRISASRPKTPAAGRNPLGSLPGASLAHVPPRNPLGAKESRAAVIPSFILLFSRDKLEPKPLLPFPFNQGMGQDSIPWKCIFPLSLGARRKVRMLWERCSIPWMQTQELCLGCKDGTLEGVEQREKCPQGSRDPSWKMIPPTAWTCTSRAGILQDLCAQRLWSSGNGGISRVPVASEQFLISEGRKHLGCAGCSRGLLHV